jgi:hypothetical protein
MPLDDVVDPKEVGFAAISISCRIGISFAPKASILAKLS